MAGGVVDIFRGLCYNNENSTEQETIMKKLKFLFLLTAGIFLLNGCAKAETSVQSETADLFAMDTYMHLQVYSINGQTPIQQASERIQQLENLFSVTIPESDISRINSNQPVTVSKDTIAVLQEAFQVNQESQGALTVTIYPVLHEWGFTTEEMHVPDEKIIQELLPLADDSKIQIDGQTVSLPENRKLDLGALAKGYTSDEIMKIFQENGAKSGIISLGGNVQALGRKPDDSLWSVGVVNPFSPSENMCVLKIEDAAVITSGNYERYFVDDDGQIYWHILDPADGYPADNGFVSVTVVGKSGLRCDALSTALFVEGEEKALTHWRACNDFEMLCVTDDQRILLTEGLQESFQNLTAMPVEILTR